MPLRKRTLSFIRYIGLFFLLLLLAGCAGQAFTSKGSWVEKDDRILLQNNEFQKGNWKTRDVDIEYTCRRETQNLQISGIVTLDDYLINGFSTLNNFTLHMYALDAGGRVLDSQFLAFFGHGLYLGAPGKMTFHKQLTLPADTAAITFGYSGRVSDASKDSEGKVDWSFWKRPVHQAVE